MAPLPRPLKSAYETGFMSLPREKGNFMEIFAWRQIRVSAKVDALRVRRRCIFLTNYSGYLSQVANNVGVSLYLCVCACVRVCVCVSAAMQVKSESTKPEIHKILHCRQGRTEPFTGNMHIMKFERAV